MKKQITRIYSSESLYKQGILEFFKRMLSNLSNGQELILRLFQRDFQSRYKQSLLGWAWLFLMPTITMGTFLLLNISGVLRIGDLPVPYPIYGLLGFSLWQLFSNGLPVLTTSVTSAGALVRQINFPREVLIISSMGKVIVDFFIRLGLVIIVYILYGLYPSAWILLFPIYIFPLVFLVVGLGFIASILNVVIRDTSNFINLGMNFFLFLMPIMYTMPEKGFLAQVNKYNPIYFLINTPREIIISGTINNTYEFFLSTLLALIIFLFGWFTFYLSQSKLAERI